MAKTIKFNLNCDGRPIRTLEDLCNNFSVEDILAYYHNGLLCRWLDVRGYTDELEKVKAITEDDDLRVIKALIKVFGVETEGTTVDEDTYILRYQKEREAFIAKCAKQSLKATVMVKNHCEGYQKCIETILENKDNMALIKATIKEIDEQYSDLYNLNFGMLFHLLLSYAPMAIFAMLMRENMRVKCLPLHDQYWIRKFFSASIGGMAKGAAIGATMGAITNISNTLSEMGEKTLSDEDKKMCAGKLQTYIKEEQEAMYRELRELLTDSSKLHDILGDNLREFANKTDDHWKGIEPKGNKYMILSIEQGDLVRAFGNTSEKMNVFDISNRFVILDGIDYKSKDDTHKLLYMEV